MISILFGPPGSGKGTQAQNLASLLNVPHVATGDIFRKHKREGTPLGLQVKELLDKGLLVPDVLTCEVVESRLVERDAGNGVLLDGFPRSVPQVEWLLSWARENGQSMNAVVNLVVEDALIIERMSGRRSCPGCGASWHTVFNPTGDTCKNCGTPVVQRPDDAEAVVRDRLNTYHRDTGPALRALRERLTVVDVDGVGEIEVVGQRIRSALHLG